MQLLPFSTSGERAGVRGEGEMCEKHGFLRIRLSPHTPSVPLSIRNVEGEEERKNAIAPFLHKWREGWGERRRWTLQNRLIKFFYKKP
jgi:hypothetical protein